MRDVEKWVRGRLRSLSTSFSFPYFVVSAFSSPAFSTLAVRCRVFRSRISAAFSAAVFGSLFHFPHCCILGTLLVFLMQSLVAFHEIRRNDWRRNVSDTFWDQSGGHPVYVVLKLFHIISVSLLKLMLSDSCTLACRPIIAVYIILCK